MTGQTIMLSEARVAYLERQRHASVNVYKQDEGITRRLLAAVGDMQVRHLQPSHLEAYFFGGRHARSGQHLPGVYDLVAPRTGNHYRSRLAQFFKYCRAHNWQKADPLVNVNRRPVMPPKKTWLSAAEMLALVEAAPSARDRALIAVAVNTCLRASEITSLRLEDLDLDAGYIDVKIHKTNERDRMPISLDLDMEMRAWLKDYSMAVGRLSSEMYLVPGKTGDRFTYETQPDGTRRRVSVPGPLQPNHPLKKPSLVVQRVMRHAGIPLPERVGVHLLRRSAGLVWHERSGDIRATQAMFHHASLRTSEAYLGLNAQRAARDDLHRGQPFLMAAVSKENVAALPRTMARAGTSG